MGTLAQEAPHWNETAAIAQLWTAEQFTALTAAIVDDDWGIHSLCTLTACRYPIVHPGPCKGWKHTLHKTAPGVFHTLEKARVEKANAKRLAKIEELKKAGKPIPKALLKPITYSVPGAPPAAKIGQHAEIVGGEAHEASQAVHKAAGIVAKTVPNPHPVGTKTAGEPGKHVVAEAIKKPAVAHPGSGTTKGHIEPPKAPEKKPEPAAEKAPEPKLTLAQAAAVKASQGGTVKTKLAAYSKLTKKSYDALPQPVKDKIDHDLVLINGNTKGLATALKAQALHDQLVKGHPAPTKAALHEAQATKSAAEDAKVAAKVAELTKDHPNAKPYNGIQENAVKAGQGGYSNAFASVGHIGQLTKSEFDALDAEDRKKILDKLQAIADTGKPGIGTERAKLLHGVFSGAISPKIDKLDHEPTGHELAQAHVNGGKTDLGKLAEETGKKAAPKAEEAKAPEPPKAETPKTTPGTPEHVEVAAKPDPTTLKLVGKSTTGVAKAPIYQDPQGQKWLFKPLTQGSIYRIKADVGAAQLQSAMGLHGPATYDITLPDGTRGSIQAMYDAKDAFPEHSYNPTKLSASQVRDLQKEHVLDWLIGNNDAHSGNFLELPNGELAGIDKSHAFRFYKTDKLDYTHKPWSPLGGNKYTYQDLYQAYADGHDVHLADPSTDPALKDLIEHTQAIPDNTLKAMFRPYAEQLAAQGMLTQADDPEALLDMLVARKNSLADDFKKLYDKASAERAKKLAKKAPEPKVETPAAPKVEAPKAPEAAAEKPAVTEAKKLIHSKDWVMSKTHLEAYQKLSAADFQSLTPEEQATLVGHLKTAKVKLKDPKKLSAVDDLLDKFKPADEQKTGVPETPAAGKPPLIQAMFEKIAATDMGSTKMKLIHAAIPDEDAFNALSAADQLKVLGILHAQAVNVEFADNALRAKMLLDLYDGKKVSPFLESLVNKAGTAGKLGLLETLGKSGYVKLSEPDKKKINEYLEKVQKQAGLSSQSGKTASKLLADFTEEPPAGAESAKTFDVPDHYTLIQKDAVHALNGKIKGTYGPSDRVFAYAMLKSSGAFDTLSQEHRDAVVADLEDMLASDKVPAGIKEDINTLLSEFKPDGKTFAEKEAEKWQAKADKLKAQIAEQSTAATKGLADKYGSDVTDPAAEVISAAYSSAWLGTVKDSLWHGTSGKYWLHSKVANHPDKAAFTQAVTDLQDDAGKVAVAHAKAVAAAKNAEAAGTADAKKAAKLAADEAKLAATQFKAKKATAQALLDKIRSDAGLAKRNLPEWNAASVKKDAAAHAFHKLAGYGGPLKSEAGMAAHYLHHYLGKDAPIHPYGGQKYLLKDVSEYEKKAADYLKNKDFYNEKAAKAAAYVPPKPSVQAPPSKETADQLGVHLGTGPVVLTMNGEYGGLKPAAQSGKPCYYVDPKTFNAWEEDAKKAKQGKPAQQACPKDVAQIASLPDANGYTGAGMHQAVYAYTGGGYDAVNTELRKANLDTPTADLSLAVRRMDAAFDAVGAPQDDIVVYRGFREPAKVFGDAWNDTNLAGMSFVQKSYSSTSAAESTAEAFAGYGGGHMVMRILVRKEQKIGAISGEGGSHVHENEVILQRKVRYRIVADYGIVNGYRRVDVEAEQL